MYADGTHETSEPASNVEEIVGIAVAMITVSSVDTTIQRARPKKHAMSFLKGRRFVWSVNSTECRRLPPFGDGAAVLSSITVGGRGVKDLSQTWTEDITKEGVQ